MPIVPQSEIQVKFSEEIFKETHEKRGEILAKFSVDFRPSISREIGHKKFHANSSTHQDLKFHTAEPKFFHDDTLGVGGPKKRYLHLFSNFQHCRENHRLTNTDIAKALVLKYPKDGKLGESRGRRVLL